MDTSTSEPDGEHHSSIFSVNEDLVSYNETTASSEECIEPAPCSSNVEVNKDPFTHSSAGLTPLFTSSDSPKGICFNDGGVEEPDCVRDIIENLTEKPVPEFDSAKTTAKDDDKSFSEIFDFVVPMEHGESVLKVDTDVKTEVEDVTECEIPPEPCVSKLELLSEDEINFDGISRKSCAESSSSKDGSPSEPSCSGTSRIHSLSSDSEDDLPSINISLPFKKRKREKPLEIISSSSCSEDESKSEIDYANLTPEQIKALIEQAKRYGRVKRCKCPKKKWAELPIKGPTEGSGKCTIGKGDWSEKSLEPCAGCAGGTCENSHHKRGRHGRRRVPPTRSILAKSRARGTIGLDVPIIELSDSEEVTPVPASVVSEVTISAVPPGECIVLSSSEDDDIVCEGVIQAEVKAQATEPEVSVAYSRPDVVVLNTAPVHSSFTSMPHFSQGLSSVFPPLSTATQCPPSSLPLLPTHPIPLGQDSEVWPDLNVDLTSWDETMNLLANIIAPPSTVNSSPAVATPPERPPTPEGWSCPICLESVTTVNERMSTNCGHVFCGNCIRSAVRIHKKCPTCRKKLTMKQIHRLFL